MNQPDAPDSPDRGAAGAPDRLAEAADEERASRHWEETYGRGGGDPFAGEDWRRTMGRPGVVPGGGDWRVALRAYVSGHDRGWDSERKLSDAIRITGRAEREERAREAGAGAGTAEGPPEARRGVRRVPVPERLDFHRSAGTWRRHLPLGKRGANVRDDDTAR